MARRSQRTRFSSATVVSPSSPVGGSLLETRVGVFIPPPVDYPEIFCFPCPSFYVDDPCRLPKLSGLPLHGLFGLDTVYDDLPVTAFDVATLLFLLVGAME